MKVARHLPVVGVALIVTEAPSNTRHARHGSNASNLSREVENINLVLDASAYRDGKDAPRRVSLPELNPMVRRLVTMGHAPAIHKLRSFRLGHGEYTPQIEGGVVRILATAAHCGRAPDLCSRLGRFHNHTVGTPSLARYHLLQQPRPTGFSRAIWLWTNGARNWRAVSSC